LFFQKFMTFSDDALRELQRLLPDRRTEANSSKAEKVYVKCASRCRGGASVAARGSFTIGDRMPLYVIWSWRIPGTSWTR
jgi:hypothetical protein